MQVVYYDCMDCLRLSSFMSSPLETPTCPYCGSARLQSQRASIELKPSGKLAIYSDIKQTLNDRNTAYGDFKKQAVIMDQLSLVIDPVNPKYTASQRWALINIIQKLSRIVNGDPNYVDSWRDIAGYAELIVKEIVGQTDEQEFGSTFFK